VTSPSFSQDGATSPEGGQLNAAISNRLVQLLSEYTGRGPTRARTYLNDSIVVCVLRDTLTKGDRVLVARGQVQAVIDMRRTFQRTMRQEATAAVEELTGRPVIAFMSDHHVDPDVAVEIFMLGGEPEAVSENL
jgi:uncharacterized protein YbcI